MATRPSGVLSLTRDPVFADPLKSQICWNWLEFARSVAGLRRFHRLLVTTLKPRGICFGWLGLRRRQGMYADLWVFSGQRLPDRALRYQNSKSCGEIGVWLRCSVPDWLVFQMTRVNRARACWPMPHWHVSFGHASQWGMLHQWFQTLNWFAHYHVVTFWRNSPLEIFSILIVFAEQSRIKQARESKSQSSSVSGVWSTNHTLNFQWEKLPRLVFDFFRPNNTRGSKALGTQSECVVFFQGGISCMNHRVKELRGKAALSEKPYPRIPLIHVKIVATESTGIHIPRGGGGLRHPTAHRACRRSGVDAGCHPPPLWHHVRNWPRVLTHTHPAAELQLSVAAFKGGSWCPGPPKEQEPGA